MSQLTTSNSNNQSLKEYIEGIMRDEGREDIIVNGGYYETHKRTDGETESQFIRIDKLYSYEKGITRDNNLPTSSDTNVQEIKIVSFTPKVN